MATKDLEIADAQPAVEESNKTNSSSSTSKKRKTTITEIEVDLNQPEPPSKKARRALKKGKVLPTKPQSGDENDSDEDKATGDGVNSKEKEMNGGRKKERSPYGIWIGNLRFTVTKNDLRKWFVANSGGEITDELITRVNLPTAKPVSGGPGPKNTVENRGFAYVDFATFEANGAAIALSETEWNGRKVLIKDAKSYEGRPQKAETTEGEAKTDNNKAGAAAPGGDKKKNPSTKIFVGNLSFTTTEDDLQAHFEKCGKIRWVKVATFEDTGKCKGYGWVNFEEPEAAQWAVKGFVKVREMIDTLEDFIEKDDDEGEKKNQEESTKGGKDEDSKVDGGDDEKSTRTKTKEKEPPRIKTRKWWVNQLLGRNLKIELAEDDQLRYAKRFKKGGQKNKEGKGGGGNPRQQQRNAEDGGAHGKKDVPIKEKKQAYADDIAVARLTGAAVAPQGKKTTFD